MSSPVLRRPRGIRDRSYNYARRAELISGALDKLADAAYARVSDVPVHATREVGDQRVLDYDAQGDPVGIEFLGVSRGVSLRDLPYRDELARHFGEHQIPVLV